ncbi:tyrosine-type recombinase/integrase [Blastococcus sp. SYSU DS0541]
MWIEKRGRQHRVYWRNPAGLGLPARSYQRLESRGDAEQFIGMAAHFGLDTARQVMATPDASARRELLAAAQAEQAPAPAGVAAAGPLITPGVRAATAAAPDDPRLSGVSFRTLWTTFLDRHRHVRKGTRELYKSYGKYHLLPFFGDTDIALIQRTRPLRPSDALPGALYVEDDWLKKMEATPKRDNMGRLRPGTLISYDFIGNVLTVLGQCLDVAIQERPPVLHLNPATGIRLPKQDRREMFFLDDAAAYAVLRCAMHEHFRPLLDFLVGTGARYGEAAGLLVRHLHLDADRPYVDIRLALKWRGKKWTLGRPKTRSSVRRILLPPKLVDVLRPLVKDKGPEDYVFNMVEGKPGDPLHHGNFHKRYWKEAVADAGTGAGVPKAIRIHDLRHTHAAWLLCAGEAPIVVAKRLGHSSTTTTQDIYGHITTESDDRAITIVDGLLPDVLARDEEGATVVTLTQAEEQMPEFDIDDQDDLAA